MLKDEDSGFDQRERMAGTVEPFGKCPISRGQLAIA